VRPRSDRAGLRLQAARHAPARGRQKGALIADFRGEKIINREASGSWKIALASNSIQFPTAKTQRPQREFAMNKTKDDLDRLPSRWWTRCSRSTVP